MAKTIRTERAQDNSDFSEIIREFNDLYCARYDALSTSGIPVSEVPDRLHYMTPIINYIINREKNKNSDLHSLGDALKLLTGNSLRLHDEIVILGAQVHGDQMLARITLGNMKDEVSIFKFHHDFNPEFLKLVSTFRGDLFDNHDALEAIDHALMNDNARAPFLVHAEHSPCTNLIESTKSQALSLVIDYQELKETVGRFMLRQHKDENGSTTGAANSYWKKIKFCLMDSKTRWLAHLGIDQSLDNFRFMKNQIKTGPREIDKLNRIIYHLTAIKKKAMSNKYNQ